jgi:tetratricopeptide (TPR) repeat protein
MKKIVLNTIVFLTLSIYGQDSLYYRSMKDAVDSMNNIKSLDDFNNIANIFERIAKAEQDKWLPYYYTGYIYVILGFKQQGSGKLDEYLDIAQENIDKAMELDPDESELYTLQGLLYQSRIMDDPQARGQIYSPKAAQALEKAIELNENNPRPYYLMGSNLFYTPEAYGGGLEAACPLLKTAKEKYENFVPADSISPNWGEEYNLQLLEKCQNLN